MFVHVWWGVHAKEPLSTLLLFADDKTLYTAHKSQFVAADTVCDKCPENSINGSATEGPIDKR